MLHAEDIQQFHQQGYLVLKQFCPQDLLSAIKQTTHHHLSDRIEPLELEAELQYPGAPLKDGEGHQTIRRLKQAYDRDTVFQQWGKFEPTLSILRQLFSTPVPDDEVLLVRAHHNCVMTKHPRFSSDSWWHQDLRYWRYSKGELISSWLALGDETEQNGCLQVIPGSHRDHFVPEQFDEAKFYRQDREDNQQRLADRVKVELTAGDLVLFHCRLLHAATRNRTDQTKLALVYTYRSNDDVPEAGSRSASLPDEPFRPNV